MTKANDTTIQLNQNSEIGINCFIKPEDQDSAVMLLRVVERLKIMLNDIPVATMPSDNVQLMHFIKNVADISKSASSVLTPVDLSQNYQCSPSFYAEAKAMLARQAH